MATRGGKKKTAAAAATSAKTAKATKAPVRVATATDGEAAASKAGKKTPAAKLTPPAVIDVDEDSDRGSTCEKGKKGSTGISLNAATAIARQGRIDLEARLKGLEDKITQLRSEAASKTDRAAADEIKLRSALVVALERAQRAEREAGQVKLARDSIKAEAASLTKKLKLAELRAERDMSHLASVFSSVVVSALTVGHQVPAGSNLHPNPCLKARSGHHSRVFEAGLRSCGLNLGSLADNNTVVAFHGTGNAHDILCNGFDPSTRKRQVHGAGEYFAHDWNTAYEFAQDRTASGLSASAIVIVTLLIKPKARSVTGHNGAPWFVVDNPPDPTVSYCIPLMYIPLDGCPLPPCPHCSARHLAVATAKGQYATVEFLGDDDATWTPMSADDAAKVIAARASGQSLVDLAQWRYRYDWAAGTQLNVQTGRVRRIRFP